MGCQQRPNTPSQASTPSPRGYLHPLTGVVKLKPASRTQFGNRPVMNAVRLPKAHLGSPDNNLLAIVLVEHRGSLTALLGFLRLME